MLPDGREFNVSNASLDANMKSIYASAARNVVFMICDIRKVQKTGLINWWVDDSYLAMWPLSNGSSGAKRFQHAYHEGDQH